MREQRPVPPGQTSQLLHENGMTLLILLLSHDVFSFIQGMIAWYFKILHCARKREEHFRIFVIFEILEIEFFEFFKTFEFFEIFAVFETLNNAKAKHF